MSREAEYAQMLVGGATSILTTDAYKFSMAQAGFPLRRETFYLSCRRGGPYKIPLDFAEVACELVKHLALVEQDEMYLEERGYGLTPAMVEALRGTLDAWSPPVGSWVGDGEPALTVTGPSFLVSWLEPLAIMFRYAMQVATADTTDFYCTCATEAEIARLVRDACGISAPADIGAYQQAVRSNAEAVERALRGARHRAFEVGFRAATCLEMHGLALLACGLERTSNVYLAKKFGLNPIGTTGHEHQQRWFSDETGFRAIRDMRPGAPSYLFDTYDTLGSGIPAAVRVMHEDPSRKCFVRFDSGDHDEQLRQFLAAERECGIAPGFIFEDGYTAERAASREALCPDLRARFSYGFGGYLVNPPGAVQFRRDDASAVYKLSQTGGVPVMKICGEKSSLPGVPVTLVGVDGARVVAQQGEVVEGFHPLSARDPRPNGRFSPFRPSRMTALLVEECRRRAGAQRVSR